MQKNYKRLGDYIQQVDERNSKLEDLPLMGLSIQKKFIPSIANTIGTNMSTYKIIRKNQFAYGPVTSRNGDKITIALFKDYDKALISQAYIPFKIIDTTKLIPEYLMMWFRRPEFDRYTRFKSHGSAREIFSWEEMCDVWLPIPDITQQQALVDEYQTIERRIQINEQLCQKLEETAQALYRKYFVEDIDPENLPEGWRWGKISEVAEIRAGGDKPSVFSEIRTDICSVPIFSNGLEKNGLYGYTDKAVIFEKSITISARGTIGFCCLRDEPFVPIVRLIVITPFHEYYASYLCEYLSKLDFEGSGSVQNQLTIPYLDSQGIILPNEEILKIFEDKNSIIRSYCKSIELENQQLKELLSLLLVKMGRKEEK